jgi:hypothetical protein
MAAPLAVQQQQSSVPVSERLLLDEQDAANMLTVSVKTLRKLPIPRVKIGALVRYRRLDLDAYVRSLV